MLAIVGVVAAVRRARRARQLIARWAAAEGLQVASLSYKWIGFHIERS